MSRYLDRAYAGLDAYTPGEQPQDRTYIKLNTNESPYPPAPAVLRAIDAASVADLRLYPDPACTALTAALAETYGVQPENVFVANGSDDILNFAFTAYGANGRRVCFPDISYGFYPVYAALHHSEAVTRPLREDFSIDPADYFEAGGMVCIANPNAPTGLSLPPDVIEDILRHNPDQVVLIDEAYVDFGATSVVPLTACYENLLVVQTFSKSRSLAGGRLGYAIGCADLIADLMRLKFSTNPYAINRLSLLAATAALSDPAYYRENCARIAQTREKTAAALRTLGLTVLPSKANFLFASAPGVDGETLYLGLKARGILVRYFSKPRTRDFVRITIGTPEEMEALTAAVRDILGPGETPPTA